MSRIVGTSISVMVVLVMSGCPTPIGGGAPIEVPADPLTATGTLDTPRAVSKQFGWHAGGEMEVTSADGVVFHLLVPDTALVEDTTITMTPFASLTTPLGETSYGVQFEPAGLFPTAFLELTITPPAGQTWPVDQQVPFNLAGSTNVVSLALMDATPEVKLWLGHFSAYGLALAQKGFSASLEPARHRLGGDVEAELENTLGEALVNDRQGQLLGSGGASDVLSFISDFAKRYVAQVIKPRLAAAKDSCANALLATQTTLSFERQMQLIGVDAQSAFGFTFSFEEMFANSVVCMKEEYELCRDNHILTRIIPSFLGVLRQAELIGFDSQSTVSISKVQSEQYLGKCLKFDLELTSSVRYSNGSGVDNHTVSESMHLTHATAAYVITTDEAGGLPAAVATGALITGTFQDFPVSGYTAAYADTCVSVTATTPGPGQLAMTTVAFTAMEGDPATRAHVKDFSLVLSLLPNTSSHDVSRRSRDASGVCTGTPTTETLQENWSTLGFAPWLGSLPAPGADAYVTGWTIVGGDIIATKDVLWNSPDGAAFTANFILRHVPDAQ